MAGEIVMNGIRNEETETIITLSDIIRKKPSDRERKVTKGYQQLMSTVDKVRNAVRHAEQ